MRVTHARIAWAASTIGAAPVGLGGIRRPRAEATWRSAMVEATLQQTLSPRRWVRTAAYDRLDPSEKSAISYFHGMVGARLMSEEILEVPLLVHLDAVLAHLGASTSKSRPDFVGYDPVAGTYSIALEAKGRSRGWSDDPLTSAKYQALLFPSVVGTTTTITAASLMYFEDNAWVGHFEDPPSVKNQALPLSPGLLTASYYLPIVQAMVELGDANLDRGSSAVYADLPESGIGFVLPTFIFDALSSLPIRQDLDADALVDAGNTITASWRRAVDTEQEPQDPSSSIYPPQPSVLARKQEKYDPDDIELDSSDDVELGKAWTGLDLVTVIVSDAWPAQSGVSSV